MLEDLTGVLAAVSPQDNDPPDDSDDHKNRKNRFEEDESQDYGCDRNGDHEKD